MVVPGSIPNMICSVGNVNIIFKADKYKSRQYFVYLSMPKIQDKMRSILFWSLKFFVMLLGIAFLFWSLQSSRNELILLSDQWSQNWQTIAWATLILSIGSFLNWFGEIKKWYHLIGNISFFEATKQSLIGHSLALFTPNKWGEYGGKCLFYPKHLSAKIIANTGAGHLAQLIMTLSFGALGLGFGLQSFKVFELIQIRWSWMILLPLLFILLFYFKIIRQKIGLVIKNLLSLESLKIKKTLFWSGFRYMIFAHQFLLLLWCFGAEMSYANGIILISLVYLFASVIPAFAIADVVVKGSIAITLMSFVGIEASTVLVVVFVMWVGNTLLPAFMGYLWIWAWQPAFINQKL